MASENCIVNDNPKCLEQRLANLEENYLHCIICFEQYNDPRILDCVHSFCLKCIQKHVKNKRIIRCPVCNQEMNTPKNGVESLKVNFFIKNLIEEFSCMSLKEKVVAGEKTCDSCTTGNPATAHCEDCNCNICYVCEDQHAKLKIWQGHSVVRLVKDEIDPEQKEHLMSKAQKDVKQIDKNIKGIYRVLEQKISYLESKVTKVEEAEKKNLALIDESHDKLSRSIVDYIKGLKENVTANKTERLGNMREVLEAYQSKLKQLNSLKNKRESLNDVNIKDHATLSQELICEIEQFVVDFTALPFEVVPSGIKDIAFVESKRDQTEYKASCDSFIGFISPLHDRKERHVSIFTREMSDSMTDYAVECANDVLDQVGHLPRRVRTYNTIAEKIIDKFIKRYERGKWSCVVTPLGCWGMNISYRRLVAFTICQIDIFIFDRD